MASLLALSGREVVRVLESFGWEVARQRGSHIVMTKEGEMATLSGPDHVKWRKARCGASSILPISRSMNS